VGWQPSIASLPRAHVSSLELKIPPPLVGLLAATIAYLLAQALPTPRLALPWQHVAGPLALLGACVSAAGFHAFWRARTTIDPLQPQRASTLVTTGIYAFSRNPMYLGLLITLVGWAMYLLSAAALIGPMFFAAYVHRFQVVPEERLLERGFGPAYARYRERVRRWL
jgi:protein-S-isoprenylcysteine O-methyltransferase Ste14